MALATNSQRTSVAVRPSSAGDNELPWIGTNRSVDGYEEWRDGTFNFDVVPSIDDRRELQFCEHMAGELSDDDRWIDTSNWGRCSENHFLPCPTLRLRKSRLVQT
jgi:hypothetical protein